MGAMYLTGLNLYIRTFSLHFLSMSVRFCKKKNGPGVNLGPLFLSVQSDKWSSLVGRGV